MKRPVTRPEVVHAVMFVYLNTLDVVEDILRSRWGYITLQLPDSH